MSNTSYRRLDEMLEKRPLPLKFGQVHLGLAKQISKPLANVQSFDDNAPGNNTDETDELVETDKNEEEIESGNIDETSNTNVSTTAPVIIVDKRKTSMLDRLAVLKRIQDRGSGVGEVIDSSEARSPVQITEPSARIIPVLTGRVVRQDHQNDIQIKPTESTKADVPQINTSNLLIGDTIKGPAESTTADVPQTNTSNLLIGDTIKEPTEAVVLEPIKKPRKLKILGKKELAESVEPTEKVDITTAVIRTQKVIDRLPREREDYYKGTKLLYE